MVKLRLARFGAKKRPFYRIVAADSRGKRDGRFIELLGTYDPLTDPIEVKIDMERVDYWLSVGAQPTGAVHNLIKRMKAGEGTLKEATKASRKRFAAAASAEASVKQEKVADEEAVAADDRDGEPDSEKVAEKVEDTQ